MNYFQIVYCKHKCCRELKRLLLIIDNFVPVEVKVRLHTQARYDEEQEEWSIHPSHMAESTVSAAGGAHTRRPVSVVGRRRPVSEFALKQVKSAEGSASARVPTNGQQQSSTSSLSSSPSSTAPGEAAFAAAVRYKGENIVSYDLDYPMRTTHEYQSPKVSASLQAVLAEAMQTNDVLDINGQVGNVCVYVRRLRAMLITKCHPLDSLRIRQPCGHASIRS